MRLTSVLVVLSFVIYAHCALVTDPNDPRVWQGANVGTFAQLVYGADTPANRQLIIQNKLLDDGILTADISQTGTLVPNSWSQSYQGCSGLSYNNVHTYTCSAGRNIFDLANQIDELWFQSSGTVGNTVWDLGVDAPQAAIFVTIDHGPLPVESIESSHYLASSPNGPWEQTFVVRVYLQGYLPDDPAGVANLYDGFTYVVRHPRNQTFRYISSIHGGPGALQSDGDDEINGVVALDLDFNPTRPPFNVCVNISTIASSVRQQIKPVLLSGRWTATAQLNYGYDLSSRSYGARGTPRPKSNSMLVFFTHDYQNQFALNFLIDSNDGSGGSAQVRIKTTALGPNANIVAYDDPTSASPSSSDGADTYQYFPSTGEGLFTWNWGASTTDGLVIGPLDIATATTGFTIEIEIFSSTGLTNLIIVTQQTADTLGEISVPLNQILKIQRDSCSCGNGVVDPLEQCDGSACCSDKCTLSAGGSVCRPSTGICDLVEYCDGVTSQCPPDVILYGNDCNPLCPPGYSGTNCATAVCGYWTNCTACTAESQCGWCCSTGQCLNGAIGGPTTGTCGAWQYGYCDCNPPCVTGVCNCGTCNCPIGRSGPTCALYLGCDGQSYPSLSDLPYVDACGVCNGTNSTCIGCDGLPFGMVYDHCGVCGGDGKSCIEVCGANNCEDCLANAGGLCRWCKSSEMCYDTLHNFDCDEWIEGEPDTCNKFLGDLTVAETAGLGAGVLAAIVIGAVAFAALAVLGGKKGYDAYLKGKGGFTPAQTNPMYTDNGRTGTNPFYNEMTTK